jgi:hypothetical protein
VLFFKQTQVNKSRNIYVEKQVSDELWIGVDGIWEGRVDETGREERRERVSEGR